MQLKTKILCLSLATSMFVVGSRRYVAKELPKANDVMPHVVKKQTSKKSNVILVTISSLRSDHVGIYGYNRDTTPHFDAFAKDAILFKNAFATSSWQMPAVGSLFTSLYPSQHGATHIENKMKKCTTLPGTLREYGYYTAGFSCNPRLTAEKGFSQGIRALCVLLLFYLDTILYPRPYKPRHYVISSENGCERAGIFSKDDGL